MGEIGNYLEAGPSRRAHANAASLRQSWCASGCIRWMPEQPTRRGDSTLV